MFNGQLNWQLFISHASCLVWFSEIIGNNRLFEPSGKLFVNKSQLSKVASFKQPKNSKIPRVILSNQNFLRFLEWQFSFLVALSAMIFSLLSARAGSPKTGKKAEYASGCALFGATYLHSSLVIIKSNSLQRNKKTMKRKKIGLLWQGHPFLPTLPR